ncbi:MAG: Nif3-like dinuclear metal center hexameric protein [Fimbriimonadales bacterium]
MPQVRNAMEALERIAPARYAFPFDKVGLQVGDSAAELTRGVVSMDRSLGAVAFAAEHKAQMLVAHHPLIFEPISSVVAASHIGRTILQLARHNIAFAAAHTNWDSAGGGINDALAGIFELSDVKEFGYAAEVKRLKVVVFTPRESVEKLVDAVSEAGAGIIGNYSRCAFYCPGEGAFLGNADSNPTIGRAGQVEKVEEVRIEMVLPEDRARAVAKAIRRVHPYEEPAFDFFLLAADSEQPAGRVGTLPEPVTTAQLVEIANKKLEAASWAWGDPDRKIRKLAFVGGAADGELHNAREAGADAQLTGEVKQHVGLEAAEEGFALIASGHYATEHPGCVVLRDRLAQELPEVDWLMYKPEPGFAGRPFLGTGR